MSKSNSKLKESEFNFSQTCQIKKDFKYTCCMCNIFAENGQCAHIISTTISGPRNYKEMYGKLDHESALSIFNHINNAIYLCCECYQKSYQKSHQKSYQKSHQKINNYSVDKLMRYKYLHLMSYSNFQSNSIDDCKKYDIKLKQAQKMTVKLKSKLEYAIKLSTKNRMKVKVLLEHIDDFSYYHSKGMIINILESVYFRFDVNYFEDFYCIIGFLAGHVTYQKDYFKLSELLLSELVYVIEKKIIKMYRSNKSNKSIGEDYFDSFCCCLILCPLLWSISSPKIRSDIKDYLKLKNEDVTSKTMKICINFCLGLCNRENFVSSNTKNHYIFDLNKKVVEFKKEHNVWFPCLKLRIHKRDL